MDRLRTTKSRSTLLYLLFFCSGLSGLIYQVVWVRVFGNVFGNTVYSASLVVAVFMLGLGVGGYVVGRWADRRYGEPGLDRDPAEPLLRAYGYFELVIAALGCALSAILPHLSRLSALVTSYSREASSGWYVLSTSSYVARAAIAVSLLGPITLVMGGTLTLLIRYLVRRDLEAGARRIALLYAVNTAGAAVGCFLTDFLLVPLTGLQSTQFLAVSFNAVAGVGAMVLARNGPKTVPHRRSAPARDNLQPVPHTGLRDAATILTTVSLAMIGVSAMGMEILWFRHITILLGGFRAVFALLLTVILTGIGVGSLVSGFVNRRNVRPAEWLMVVQGLFVAATLLGLASADARSIEHVVMATRAARAVNASTAIESGIAVTLAELWFNARPILLEVGLPALLMGFSFPLANAVVQRTERSVGGRAGLLYLGNTFGAVCGSLIAGFLLLPRLGIQGSATVLTIAAGLVVVPLSLVARLFPSAGAGVESESDRLPIRAAWSTPLISLAVAGVALIAWLRLPSAYVIAQAAPPLENERVLALSEGVTELTAVTEQPGRGRLLRTNGHPMSSTTVLSQRYMRALAHLPLLSMDNPETALVIGFGVGNTAHAAALHPSIRRVEIADLSKGVLAHAGYFREVNRDVLGDPRVVVYVNDGRQHLQMQPVASYDLVTLEPPPIGYAGVAALYSEEFYELVRTRLKARGYLTQWLPAYQVPAATTLAMIRAFLDVFPQSVLISGAEADLVLIGVNDARIEMDPTRLATALSKAPAVQADLRRLDLGTVREIVGTFVGSAQTLAAATRNTAPVSDDRPIQEYGVQSLLDFGESVPASVVDLSQVASWCPGCFAGGRPVPLVDGLDTYLALLGLTYAASPPEVARARSLAERQHRVIVGSAYLGAIVPESADVHNLLGIALAEKGGIDDAITEFYEALRLQPDSAATYWHLGAAVASRGARQEAIAHLRRSVQLDANNGQVHLDLGVLLFEARQFEDAVAELHAAVRLMPNSVKALNGLGAALAIQQRLDEAIDTFQRALTIDPESAETRRNLAIAERERRGLTDTKRR